MLDAKERRLVFSAMAMEQRARHGHRGGPARKEEGGNTAYSYQPHRRGKEGRAVGVARRWVDDALGAAVCDHRTVGKVDVHIGGPVPVHAVDVDGLDILKLL